MVHEPLAAAPRLAMLEKERLTPAQLELVEARISRPEHRDDEGPSRAWRTWSSGLYAYFALGSGELVALVDAQGAEEARPGWWIDSAFRGQGYGREVVDLLAARLKARGVTRIGFITIATHKHLYDRQSGSMVRRLRRHFEG